VDGVAAAVVCGGSVAARTDVVPLSKTEDAKVSPEITVPANCATPLLALRERYQGKVGGWLAATGRYGASPECTRSGGSGDDASRACVRVRCVSPSTGCGRRWNTSC